MTTSANSNFNPTAEQILRMGFQLCGLVPMGRDPTAQQFLHGRFFLDAFLKEGRGASLITLEQTSITTVSGTATYTLAADTVDANFPMMALPVGSTGSQTQVSQMVYDDYQQITSKTQTGVPIRCYVEKLATVTLTLWPVPNAAYSVTFQRQRLIRNAESGTTLDVTASWFRGVAFQVAADVGLAGSVEIGRVQYLQKQADKSLTMAQNRETETGDCTMVLPDL